MRFMLREFCMLYFLDIASDALGLVLLVRMLFLQMLLLISVLLAYTKVLRILLNLAGGFLCCYHVIAVE